MAKRHIERPKRELSKQQLSQWQRERKRSRLIFTIGVAIIAVVVAIVSVGWYINDYRPLHENIIRVNGTSFTMQYYIDMLKYYQRISPDYWSGLSSYIVSDIEQGELRRQAAAALGYTVSDSEAAEELAKNELPRTRASLDVARSSLLIDKLRTEYLDPQVPKTAEQVQVQAIFLESQSQAKDVKTRLEVGEDFATLAGELSLQSTSKENKGDLGWHPRSIYESMLSGNTSLVDYIFSTELDQLSEPMRDSAMSKSLGYWLINVTEKNAETQEAHVLAMLLTSEEEATIVKNRLAAGEDFESIAKDLSQLDTGNEESKSDLGMVKAGQYTQAFDAYVFSPDVMLNEVSAPIRDEEAATIGGYWLVKTTGKESDREISTDDRNILIAKAFNDWVGTLNSDLTNIIDHSRLTGEKLSWAINRVMS